MSRLHQRAPRLKLDPEQYRLLRERVLQRDGWRCQLCGSLRNLQVHHKISRSMMGDDDAQNLITLCVVPSSGAREPRWGLVCRRTEKSLKAKSRITHCFESKNKT